LYLAEKDLKKLPDKNLKRTFAAIRTIIALSLLSSPNLEIKIIKKNEISMNCNVFKIYSGSQNCLGITDSVTYFGKI
jgi:ferredoxin-fold anticodon binding domain-containing protein